MYVTWMAYLFHRIAKLPFHFCQLLLRNPYWEVEQRSKIIISCILLGFMHLLSLSKVFYYSGGRLIYCTYMLTPFSDLKLRKEIFFRLVLEDHRQPKFSQGLSFRYCNCVFFQELNKSVFSI